MRPLLHPVRVPKIRRTCELLSWFSLPLLGCPLFSGRTHILRLVRIFRGNDGESFIAGPARKFLWRLHGALSAVRSRCRHPRDPRSEGSGIHEEAACSQDHHALWKGAETVASVPWLSSPSGGAQAAAFGWRNHVVNRSQDMHCGREILPVEIVNMQLHRYEFEAVVFRD